MVAHICSRFKKEGERVMPREYKAQLSREYSAFQDIQQRTIKALRSQLLLRKLSMSKEGSQINLQLSQRISRVSETGFADKDFMQLKKDFFDLVVPALDRRISGNRFFVGDEQTMLDLIIFVELETVLVLMEDNPHFSNDLRAMSNCRSLNEWLQSVRGLPDFHEVNIDFTRKVKQLASC